MEVWKAFSAQVLRGGSCGVAEKEGAGIQSKGSCNASAQVRGSCLKNGLARAMNVINNGISDPISYTISYPIRVTILLRYQSYKLRYRVSELTYDIGYDIEVLKRRYRS